MPENSVRIFSLLQKMICFAEIINFVIRLELLQDQ